MKATVKLSMSQNLQLYGKNDTNKGKVIEELVKQVLKKAGAEEIYSYYDKENQVNLGDLQVLRNNRFYNIEVKSSHSYNNSYDY